MAWEAMKLDNLHQVMGRKGPDGPSAFRQGSHQRNVGRGGRQVKEGGKKEQGRCSQRGESEAGRWKGKTEGRDIKRVQREQMRHEPVWVTEHTEPGTQCLLRGSATKDLKPLQLYRSV